jgi:hypothetical protein
MRCSTAGPSALSFTMTAVCKYGRMVGQKSSISNIHAVPPLVSYAGVSATSYIMTMTVQIPQTSLDRLMSRNRRLNES